MWPLVSLFCSRLETDWFPTVKSCGSRRSPALTAPVRCPCLRALYSQWMGCDLAWRVCRGLTRASGAERQVQRRLSWQRNHWRNLEPVPGAGYTAHCLAGWRQRPSEAAPRPRFSWFQLLSSPACPATFTDPPSLAFPVTLRALNSLSLNSFSVSVGQSGFLRFVNKEPDRSGKKTKALRAADSEWEKEELMSEQSQDIRGQGSERGPCAREAAVRHGGCSREGRAECSGLGKGHSQALISGAEEGRSRGIKASEDQREKHLRVTKRVREQTQSERAGGLWHAAEMVRGPEAGGGRTA